MSLKIKSDTTNQLDYKDNNQWRIHGFMVMTLKHNSNHFYCVHAEKTSSEETVESKYKSKTFFHGKLFGSTEILQTKN